MGKYLDLLESLKIEEGFKLDLGQEPPSRGAHLYRKIIWAYGIISKLVEEDEGGFGSYDYQENQDKLDRVISTIIEKETGITDEEELFRYFWEMGKKSKHLQDFLSWFLNDPQSPSVFTREKSRNLEKDVEDTFQFALKHYNYQKKKAGKEYKWRRFIEKIAGRSEPKLTLEEQGELIKARDIPPFVWAFLTGREEKKDLSARMTLDTSLDLYIFPKLPKGGRIAQTIPETLLVNFYSNMKQNILAMGFSQDEFMSFIFRFIGEREVRRWFKTGTVYRTGKMDQGRKSRKWLPASLSLDGIKEFISTWRGSTKREVEVSYGRARYFDLEEYMRYLMRELGYTMDYKDSEDEVLIERTTRLDNKTTIKV